MIGTLPIFHNREETRIHTNNLHPIRVRSRFTSSYASGGAGMIGTAQYYLEALRTRNNPILKPESIELMTTNAVPDIPPPLSDPGWTFGFGFSIHMLGAPDCEPWSPQRLAHTPQSRCRSKVCIALGVFSAGPYGF
jgi:hypothetical protein